MFFNDSITLATAQIFDLQGRSIQKSSITNTTINVEKLVTGTYILLLTDTDGKEYTSKFIKE